MTSYFTRRVYIYGVVPLVLSILCRYSYGSKRLDVVKTGTTAGPNFHRPEGAWSTACPGLHPYVLEKGRYCCAHKAEVENLPSCDSSKLIGPKSNKECCNNPIKCPYQFCRGLDGAWSTWGSWSVVSAYCPTTDSYFEESKQRSRECIPDQYGAQTCHPLRSTQEQIVPLDSSLCPAVDGEWSAWGPWTVFSAYCASADAYYDDKKKRSRECQSEHRGNQICQPVGSTEEEEVPNENAGPSCPITNGEWTTWSPWNGVGTFCAAANAYFKDRKKRNRQCQSEENGEQICQPVGGTEVQVVPDGSANPSCTAYSEVLTCGGYSEENHWKCRINKLHKLGNACTFLNMPEKRSNGVLGRGGTATLWYCGGRSSTTSPEKGCFEYKKSSNKWKALTANEAGGGFSHYTHGVQVKINTFLIIGGAEKVGTNKNAPMVKTYYYTSSNGKLKRGPNLPSPAKMSICSALFNQTHVIAIGGVTSSGAVRKEILINSADFSSAGAWTKITDMPTARKDLVCGVARPGYYVEDSPSLIVVTAGEIGGSTVKTTDIYDTGTGEWRVGPLLPYKIGSSSAVPYLGSFVILYKKHFHHLEFDTTTKDWSWKELRNANNLESTVLRGVMTKKGDFSC